MKLSDIKRDSAAIAAGQWVSDLPGMGDLKLRVRGASSPIVSATKAAKERAATRKDRDATGKLKPEAENRIWGEVMAEVILLDWEGIIGEDGKPEKYNRERALDLCTNPDWIEFQGAVVTAAVRVDTENTGRIEDAVGN